MCFVFRSYFFVPRHVLGEGLTLMVLADNKISADRVGLEAVYCKDDADAGGGGAAGGGGEKHRSPRGQARAAKAPNFHSI